MQKNQKIKRPKDPIELAKLIGDIAIGEMLDEELDSKDEKSVRSGSKGGKNRAKNLTQERRSEIAQEGARARWENKN